MRKTLIFFFLTIFFSGSISSKTCPQILTGKTTFDFWQSGKPIEIGKGERFETKHIKFSTSFCQTPQVHISMSGFDVSKDYLEILRITAKNVSQRGFDVMVSTSEDAKVYGAMVTWVAFQIGGDGVDGVDWSGVF